MTPAELAQMIEGLAPSDKEAAEEYIYLLHLRTHPEEETELDAKYREYVLQGIREGEEAIERGEYYDSKEARKKLIELLNRSHDILTKDWLTPEEDNAWKDL